MNNVYKKLSDEIVGKQFHTGKKQMVKLIMQVIFIFTFLLLIFVVVSKD